MAVLGGSVAGATAPGRALRRALRREPCGRNQYARGKSVRACGASRTKFVRARDIRTGLRSVLDEIRTRVRNPYGPAERPGRNSYAAGRPLAGARSPEAQLPVFSARASLLRSPQPLARRLHFGSVHPKDCTINRSIRTRSYQLTFVQRPRRSSFRPG